MYDLQSNEAKELLKLYIKEYQDYMFLVQLYLVKFLMYYLPSTCLPMFQIKLKNGGFDKSLQKIEDERNKLLGNRPDIRPHDKVLDYFKQFGIFKSLQKFDIFKNVNK